MNRIKKIFRLIHLGLWALFTFLVGFQLGGEGQTHWLTLTTGFILTSLYVFYSHFLLLTDYPGKRNRGGYFLRLAGIMLTGPIPFLFFHYKKMDFLDLDLLFGYYSMTLITVVPIFIFLSWLARVTENLVLNTIRKEQLEKQAVEAELYYLKSQINPHFLFNTLNNIHTLVYKQAPAAPEAVMRLASLMRYMIYESNAPMVPLTREMNYLQDYVGLQQLRYKKSPVVNLEITGDIASCHIAPLLFIHLLENAYKHSPARLEPGAIKVSIAVKENTLTCCIQNPVSNNAGNALNEAGGIGLPNVRKRLALLYPGQHSLEINSTGEIFIVTLKIHSLHLQVYEEKLTCYIIDDEPLAQEILEAYIAKVPFLELKGTFMSPLEAAAQINKDKPDLLFLDINMPDLDGLSFIPMLNPKPMIILTTAYDQYALKAFELEVKDYLVKPFPFERFYKGVLRLYQEQSPKQQPEKKEAIAEPKQEQAYIFLKVGHRIQKIATRDIFFIEAMKDYLRIHTAKEKIMTLLSFAKLEELLPTQDFARVHRSFLVAIDKIDHIEKNRIRIADQTIPISDTYNESFYKKLKGLT